MTDALPYLSIIIPAHNEEQRLPHTLEQVADFLSRQDFSSEIIVVENGSSDRTLALAQAYAQRMPNLRRDGEIEWKPDGVGIFGKNWLSDYDYKQ